MKKDHLKIEILQNIIACEDEDVLQRLNEILQNYNVAEDPAEEYPSKNFTKTQIPDSYYIDLVKEYIDFLNGNLNTKSWQEVRSALEENNGL